MFELNPLNNPDALWQHITMLAVAGIIGYIIGYITANKIVTALESRLNKLDNDLRHCQTKKAGMQKFASQPTFEAETIPVITQNLKLIEGIGPQIEILFNKNGIQNFSQLRNASPEYLSEILRNGGKQFQMHDPETWPSQAALAEDEKWDELKAWQEELNKGRQE